MKFPGWPLVVVVVVVVALAAIVVAAESRLAVPAAALDGAPGAGVLLTFPNLAALKAFNVAAPGSNAASATTAGYRRTGDGGASIYDWDPRSILSPDDIFVLRGADAPTGRWILRFPNGSIHPEQAGAACDGVTDDYAALTALSNAIHRESSLVRTSIRIALNPNKLCLFSSGSWITPDGTIVSGTINPVGMTSLPTQHWYNSGFVHPPSVTLQLGYGGKLENLVVLRQDLPEPQTTFQGVMSRVMTWAGENGAVTSVAPAAGRSGAGCSVGDRFYLQGGAGDHALLRVDSAEAGAVTGLSLLDPGAYDVFPPSPAGTGRPPYPATTCTTMPAVAITTGTPRSIGVAMRLSADALENVIVIGFNLGVFSSAGETRMDHVFVEDVNGIEITHEGANGVYRDLNAGPLWSASASQSSGVASISKVDDGGSLNRPGDILTVQAGRCAMPPRIAVDTVDTNGAILSAHVSTYGDCSVQAKANPAPVANLHGGEGARLTLLWASYDYYPGIAFNFHDQCDGCMFSDLAAHGWNTGIRLSNVWALDIVNAVLEPANFSLGPNPQPIKTYGLRTENCVMAAVLRLNVNGFDAGASLYGTDGAHAADPGYGCASGVDPTSGNWGITIIGGDTGSPVASDYGIDAGPYSRGIVSGVSINASGAKAAVNIGPHSYGWVMRDIMPYNVGKAGWIRIDPTSAGAVTANAIGSGLATPVIMGGLPTSAVGLPSGAIWNNHGVLSVAP